MSLFIGTLLFVNSKKVAEDKKKITEEPYVANFLFETIGWVEFFNNPLNRDGMNVWIVLDFLEK